jgi:hypothetical protein
MPAFFLSFFFFDSIYSPHFLLSDYLWLNATYHTH